MTAPAPTPAPAARPVPASPALDPGMLFEHRRLARGAAHVEGELWLEGARWCVLLEDAWRDLSGLFGAPEPKVPAQTCIPAGLYRLTVSWSPRFGKRTAEILGIPGFTGVRYHSGAGVEHSAGCPLLGRARAGSGRLVPDPGLTDQLAELLASRKGKHYVRITDDFPAS